ncbi:hypothetical protein MMC22_006786 [Lobaria immixta]|nr:hypothetical protein [Lobaria immixta]
MTRGNESDDTCMNDENNTGPKTIRVQCSSKHLTLASSVFEAMLSRNFKEDAILRSKGTSELPLLYDDPAVLLILLNIIHGQTKEIPLEIDLCMLTKIAIVVDKYQLQMVMGILSRVWIDRLNTKIPQSVTEDLRRWIYVTWIFRCPAEFKLVTQIAERQYAIDHNRQWALLRIITVLHWVLKRYQQPNEICTSRCDSTVLGSLTKEMNISQLLIRLKAPYSKLSFDSLACRVRALKILTDSECQRDGYQLCKNYPNSCSNSQSWYTYKNFTLESIIEEQEEKLCGLDLDTVGDERYDRT